MSIQYVDYHCHLDLYSDFEKIVEECERNKINTLAVTTTPRAFPKNYQLAKNKDHVRAALGLHPQLVAERQGELSIWQEYFNNTRFIGEIGLDASPQFYKSFNEQKLVFKSILDACALSSGKILSIHSVRSIQTVIEMLQVSNVLKKNKAVLHWYSGDASSLKMAVERGCYFSINSAMLNNERARNLILNIPEEKLLTETDGPFVMFGKEPARPINIDNTILLLSRLLKKRKDETIEIIHTNLKELESAY